MPRLSIRIYLDAPRRALGPGMADLLEGIAAQGSIRKAAAGMKMSYRKAWLLIRNMRDTFGGEIVATAVGGRAGGGAQLTGLGKALLTRYRRIEARAGRAAAADMAALTAMCRPARDRKTPR